LKCLLPDIQKVAKRARREYWNYCKEVRIFENQEMKGIRSFFSHRCEVASVAAFRPAAKVVICWKKKMALLLQKIYGIDEKQCLSPTQASLSVVRVCHYGGPFAAAAVQNFSMSSQAAMPAVPPPRLCCCCTIQGRRLGPIPQDHGHSHRLDELFG
jgi:hypothetical protein